MSKYLEESYDQLMKENVELLAKLKIAEEALDDVIFETNVPVSDVSSIKRICEQALQQLRS